MKKYKNFIDGKWLDNESKETIKVEGQPDKTIKKIIEIQLIDGKLKVEEIYRV